jgi:hypothetical protein
MIPPVRRDALREREALDEADEAEAYARESSSERLAMALELSDVTRALAESVGARWVTEPVLDLEEKAELYVAPLRASARR